MLYIINTRKKNHFSWATLRRFHVELRWLSTPCLFMWYFSHACSGFVWIYCLRGGPSLSFYLITHNQSDLRERGGFGIWFWVEHKCAAWADRIGRAGRPLSTLRSKAPSGLFKELAEQCLTDKAAPQMACDVITGLQQNPPLHK